MAHEAARLATLATALAACASPSTNDSNRVNLDVIGEGFAAGEVHVAVTEVQPSSATIACEATPVSDGGFAFHLGPIIDPGVEPRVDAFVDLDGNQRCDFGVDAVMSLDFERPLVEDTSVRFGYGRTHVGDDPSGCASFGGVSYRFTLTGVAETGVRYALVRMNSDGTTRDRLILTGYVSTTDGRAVIDIPGAGLRSRAHHIDFFEAASPTTGCDTRPVYRTSINALGSDGPLQCGPPGVPLQLEQDMMSGTLYLGECASFY